MPKTLWRTRKPFPRQRECRDGKYVLRSNTELKPEEIFRAYRQLFHVERAFRTLKGPLRLRPVRLRGPTYPGPRHGVLFGLHPRDGPPTGHEAA